MAKKTNAPNGGDGGGDLGTGLYALAKAVEGLGELPASYRIEEISDSLGGISAALDRLANTTAMSVIAQYGTNEDRAAAVKHLKRRFESGTFKHE
jgi:hypothetical protein